MLFRLSLSLIAKCLHCSLPHSIPFLSILWYERQLHEPYTGPEAVATDDNFFYIAYLGTAFGSALACHYFLSFLVAIGRKTGHVDAGGVFGRFSQTSDVVGTARQKQAGTRKVNLLLQNARLMHGATDTVDRDSVGLRSSLREAESDTVFQNYTLFGEGHEDAGSLFWTWQLLYSGRLFDTEGVWLPARLWIFQLGHVVITCFVAVAHFRILDNAVSAAEDGNGSLPDGLPQWVYDIVPTGREVEIALKPAGAVAIAVCILITLIYIPRYVYIKCLRFVWLRGARIQTSCFRLCHSTVSTTLKYRCGHNPSLGSSGFHEARDGADTVSSIKGPDSEI
jgi:hypothetical protein